MQLQVPVGVVASWFMGRDKPDLKNSLGALVCLAGVAIVVGRPAATDEWFGLIAMLIGVVSWSVVQVLLPLVAKDHGIALYTAMSRYAAPQMIVASLLFESNHLKIITGVPWTAWLAVIGIALFGFALPYAVWYRLLMRRRIDELMPFLLLMPVFGVTVATTQLGEPMPPSLILGGCVVLLGLGVIVFRRRSATAMEPIGDVPPTV
jgi:O-acetylserine/cysteine efflux transporter